MKKILLIVVAILLLASAQASLSVRLDDAAALLHGDGSAIIDIGVYSDIVPLGGGLFAASADSKTYALMNEDGILLTGSLYTAIRHHDRFLSAEREGLWGLLSPSGQEITGFIYSRLVTDGENIWALKGNPGDLDSDELFILTPDGIETETGLFIRRMSTEAAQGRIAVQLQDDLSWGYCDAAGSLAIPAAYSHAGTFRAGCAAVVQNGKYGVIGLNGNFIVPAEHDFLEISPSGLILASSAENGVRVYGPDGSEIASHEGVETFGALVGNAYAVVDAERLTLYDQHAVPILDASRSAAVHEGLNGQYILSDGAWGDACVSIAGTQNKYQNLYPLGKAGEKALYACMQVHAARYMNDLLDEIQLAVDMEDALYGVVDENGEILIPAQYQSIQYVSDDRLLTHIDGLWQLMDSAGRVYWSHGVMQSEEPSF